MDPCVTQVGCSDRALKSMVSTKIQNLGSCVMLILEKYMCIRKFSQVIQGILTTLTIDNKCMHASVK